MSSGVSVREDCVKVFNEIKLQHCYRYIIYALTKDMREIEVRTTAPPSATFDQFVAELKEAEEQNECRYAVFDAEFNLNDGQKRTKLVFFLWSPEKAKIKQKMVYTSSKDYLKRKLLGIAKEVQACDDSDLSWSNVLEVCLRSEYAQ